MGSISDFVNDAVDSVSGVIDDVVDTVGDVVGGVTAHGLNMKKEGLNFWGGTPS